VKFTKMHDWVVTSDNIATIGITDYAQKELGDVVYVELPAVGHQVEQGEELVVVESTKAAVDLYAPISGEVIEINTALREYPEKLNQSAESDGWLYKLKIKDSSELSSLLDAAAYHNLMS